MKSRICCSVVFVILVLALPMMHAVEPKQPNPEVEQENNGLDAIINYVNEKFQWAKSFLGQSKPVADPVATNESSEVAGKEVAGKEVEDSEKETTQDVPNTEVPKADEAENENINQQQQQNQDQLGRIPALPQITHDQQGQTPALPQTTQIPDIKDQKPDQGSQNEEKHKQEQKKSGTSGVNLILIISCSAAGAIVVALVTTLVIMRKRRSNKDTEVEDEIIPAAQDLYDAQHGDLENKLEEQEIDVDGQV